MNIKQSIVTADELQRALGPLLERVAVGHEHIVIERTRQPVAVLLPYAEYEALLRLRAVEVEHNLASGSGRDGETMGVSDEQWVEEREAAQRQEKQRQFGNFQPKVPFAG